MKKKLAASAAFDGAKWVDAQIRRYGPVLGGKDLRDFLGFRTAAAFQKARAAGALGVSTFQLPGRKGSFVMTEEACAWLMSQRSRQAGVGTDRADEPKEVRAGVVPTESTK